MAKLASASIELLDLVDTAVCVVDRAGRVEFSNRRLLELFPQCNPGSRAVDACAPMASPGIVRLGGERLAVSHHGLEDDSRRVAWTAQRLQAPGPPTVGLEDLATEQDLLLRSEMLAALVDAAPMAILVLDLDKQVTMWNPACERLFGWNAAEILGHRYPVVPKDGWREFEAFFQTVIDGNGFTGVEAVRSTRDGREITLKISTAPIRDTSGTVTGAMAILEDVTERRALEERYRHALKMEAIGRLAGGIAHDFNNVLTVIQSYCSLLSTRIPDSSVELAGMKRAASRAGELTGQLLAFGRQQVLRETLLDLNDTIYSTVPLLQRLIGEDVRIVTDLQHGIGPVLADPTQVERLLMNLASNARDAMPDGGTLSLETSDRHAPVDRQQHDGRWARLAVRDTGVGMDERTLEHVFEPFFTTKDQGRGTGLGLASVHGIVHQTGGTIDVHSRPDQGTEFRIFLPIVEGSSLSTDPSDGRADVSADLDGLTVLVAEDDDDTRLVVAELLASRGVRTLCAANGNDALKLAATHRGQIDLLLTDVVMPGMNGRQLCEHFRRDFPETPVLFMSGYADDEVLRRGVVHRGHFLTKPFTLQSLSDAIRDALDREP